jgi:hypothetical protein
LVTHQNTSWITCISAGTISDFKQSLACICVYRFLYPYNLRASTAIQYKRIRMRICECTDVGIRSWVFYYNSLLLYSSSRYTI